MPNGDHARSVSLAAYETIQTFLHLRCCYQQMGAAFLVFGKRTDLASLIEDQNNEQFGLLLKMDVQEWLFND